MLFLYMSMNVCILYRNYRPRKQPLRVSSTINAAKVERWQRVLVFSFMSSKESFEDDESENPSHHLLNHSYGGTHKLTSSSCRWMTEWKRRCVKIQTFPHVHDQVSQRPRPTTSGGYWKQNAKLKSVMHGFLMII